MASEISQVYGVDVWMVCFRNHGLFISLSISYPFVTVVILCNMDVMVPNAAADVFSPVICTSTILSNRGIYCPLQTHMEMGPVMFFLATAQNETTRLHISRLSKPISQSPPYPFTRQVMPFGAAAATGLLQISLETR